jgi:Leucine-rich repeat (LRR) protein
MNLIIGFSPHAEFLTLNKNAITGSIPEDLASLESLRVLSFQENKFSGGIPTILGEITTLETLNFYQNPLTGTVPTELGTLTNLENLFLHFSELTGSVPESICALLVDRGVGKLSKLTADCGTRGRIVCTCCTACF